MTSFTESPPLQGGWYPVVDASDVGDEPVSVGLLGEDLVIWRASNDVIVAAPDRCPHREAPLSIGKLQDGVLSCAYHGWGFGDEGRCVSVPSSGEAASIPPTAHLGCKKVQERYGLVWVCPGDPQMSIPAIGQDTDPAFRRINTGVEH